ncbi:general substrate transporter [Aspergillus pseudoustus]|uniref:General substrate transporter n=1 Tax=Aspergillus pseudoustus TaxID=1810923 RepID=A0ABR4K3Y8_9EURO
MTLHNKPPINWRTFMICVTISLGQIIGAYESVIIGTTLQKADFMQRMGLWDSDGNQTADYSAREGAIVGLFQAGAVFGNILAAIITDRWGRKAGLMVGSIVSVPAVAGLTGSSGFPEFLVFRFLAGLGTWCCGTSASAYVPELAPPAYRGFFAGMNGVMIGIGLCLASYIGMGFYFSENAVAQWRAPMGIPLFCPLVLLCVIPFLPESPRYLLLKDRTEEARRIYDQLNPAPENSEAASLADEEFNQMKQQAAHDRTLDSSWKTFLTHPVHRKRLFMAIMLGFLGQSTGVLVINNYGQTFYQTLGFGPDARQILQGNRDLIALLGNMLGTWIIDRVGRRRVLLVAFIGCFVCVLLEAIMVALYADSDNANGKNMGVALLYIFLMFYASGIDVGTYVYMGEMFPNHLRVKGVAIGLSSLTVTATIYLSVTSTAFEAIGWKYFLLFAILTLLGTIWIALFIPETRCLPLEEIEALFGNAQDAMVISSVHVGGQADDVGEREKGMVEHVER